MEDLSLEEEGTDDATKEISAKYLPMDQTQSTQLKKLSRREYSQDQHSTGDSENSSMNEVSIPNKRTPSDQGQKFDVFLSHSGKQKNFVRQLYRDLTNQGVSCFFDQDRESLPLGEDFPPLIFEAATTCKLAVFLLSKEFLQSKWPMLELSAVVEARDTNQHPEILPLFFMIPSEALKQITTLNVKWKEIGIDDQRRIKWPQALKAIGRINGLKFSEGGNEVEFRDEIVKEIWRKLPTASPRYYVPYMQGELRMCQEVEDFFNKKVHRNKKGISIAGLYGIAGQGKTTLGKAFCNFKLKDFEGKVCHLEFCIGDSFERTKLALQYLIHCHASYLRDLTKDQAQVELHRRVNGQRVLLVLDNITEESIDEVRQFVEADLRENSCILLSARSLDVLVKHCKIDPQSCMRVPSLDEDDAIAILLERRSPEESTLEAGEKSFALKCANRCSFKEISGEIGPRGRTFHPLALKAFGRYLFSKYGWTLSKWVAEIDGVLDPSGYGLDSVFAVLGKSFDDMKPKYRTIFMLVTIYILPNMSLHNVMEWLAISCNKEIEFIEEAVEDLCKKAFIEEFNPEIRVHDLYSEFAQRKAKEMGRWLYWKGDGRSTRGFISQDNAGFELVKLEGCMRRSPSEIIPDFLKNLVVLQLVGVQNMNKLDLGQMNSLRSITLHDCKILAALDGMESFQNLAWLQIRGLGKALKLPKLSSLIGLQHLEIDITVSQLVNQLGDLTPCSRLKEINIRCPSLLKFPRLNGLPYLQRVEFGMCDKVKAPLDCRECVELQSIVLVGCCQMTAPPLLAGCENLSKIVLSDCGAVSTFPDIDMPSALNTLELQISSETSSAPKSLESCYRLENLRLLDMGELVKLPSFRSLSKLTVLEIGKCGIREPPDLTCCVMLEDVHFYTLKNLIRFPNFSLLRRLKKLNLCNCSRVRDPPDISGCHQLQLFYLQYNDNMKGLSKMDECSQLEEVKVSWECKDEVRYEGIDPYSCEGDDDLEACLDCFKDVILENLDGVSVPAELEQWMQGKTMLAKKYFRGVKLYYSVTAPYESEKSSKRYSQNPITLKLVGGKVTAYSVNEDCGWLDRVRKYFAGRDIARPSAASGKKVYTSLSLPSSRGYHVKMLTTTLAKACRDFHLRNFDPKACHLEFCGRASRRQKIAMNFLIQFRNLYFDWEADEAKAHYFLNRSVEGKRILLFLDNITEKNIDEVSYYVGVELGEMSCILWTARSVDALNNSIVSFQSFKGLQQEEVIAFLIERNGSGHREFALRCVNTCSFWAPGVWNSSGHRVFASIFHQLALEALGRDCSDLSAWLARIDGYWGRDGDHLDGVFSVLDDALKYFERYSGMHKYFYHLERWFAEVDCVDDVFAGLCWLAIMFEKERSSSPKACYEKEGSSSTEEDMFKKEIKYIKAKMSSDEVVKWLLLNCKKQIKDKAEDIKKKCRIPEDFVLTKKKRERERAWKILEDISFLFGCSPTYNVPYMQGKTRMCQEVANFFNTDAHLNEKGIHIVGLYGMLGLGKTTLANAFCNFYLQNFDGQVCLLQFYGGDILDRTKLVLRYLTQIPTSHLESLTCNDHAQYYFNIFIKGQRVLLVLDNITTDSIDEVRHYLEAEWAKSSYILLIAQSVDVLQKLNIDSESCMRVPRLEKEEAIAILLERMYAKNLALAAKHKDYASECANKCLFKEERDSAPTFHPLALKAFGRHLFRKYGSDLSKWVAEIDGLANGDGDGLDGIFSVLDKALDGMDPRYRMIFMVLARHMPHNVPSVNVIKWLAVNCYEEITYIKEAVEDLRENGFIEETQPEIHIHNFIKLFIQWKKHNYDEVGEKKFRDEIVRTIPCLLLQKYHVPAMEGEARMCQKVVDFFKTDVHPNEKGISIAGLYGMPGLGKTTLAKAFCNFNLWNFDGKVYHREFASRGHSMDRQNFEFLTKTLQGQRVLLILDNIETEESIDVVKKFVQADLGENSWILLSAQSVDVLKDFIDVNSCMSVPCLEEKEALAILLERTSLAESALKAEKRGFALQCANRCSFKQTSCHMVIRGAHTFHPLALKSFGRHLFGKYGSDLSKWVPELDGLAVGSGDGLGDMFTVLDKIFEDMDSRYHTIFMLLTVYMPPNMLPHKVTQWVAVNCKEEIDFIEKAVEDLWQKAFIEDIKPEIRINDLFVEFAQSKARKGRRWLWCNRDLSTSEAKGELFSEDEEGFELAKLEHCQHQGLSQIADRYVKNLCALQVACNEMSNLELSSMKNIRSLTLHNCEYMEVLQGMENLPYLAWFQIVNLPKLKVLNLSSLTALQYLEINTGGPTELGDLTGCVPLREIYVHCSSLWEFPRINGLPNLEKARFKACGEVIGQLDCTACVKLRSIVLENCWQMVSIPLIDGCSNLSRIVLNKCDQVTECSDEDESSALEILKLCISSEDASAPRHSDCCDRLENIPLWNVVVSKDIPSLRRFSNLTLLKLYKCDICEPPDVACCKMLEEVCFSTLKYLESFPIFSSLLQLKKLCLYNCQRVRAPPDVGGCYKIQVFHLLYNDNMKGLPKMDGWEQLEEIKLSWQSEEVFDSSGNFESDDLEFRRDYQQDKIFRNIDDVFIPVELKKWQWIQSKAVRVQQYLCGEKVYYSITALCHKQASNADSHEPVIIRRAGAISGEKKFRDEIVRTIPCLLPQKYHVPAMEGEACMCQKVVDFFKIDVHPNEKGISIAGLYGMLGVGKTRLAKAFCNFNLRNFDGKVYYWEFTSRGHSMDRQNFEFLTKGQRVLLILNNIQTEESIEVVKKFVQADLGENSWILLSAQSVDVLKDFIDGNSCMSVPCLEEKEAIAILLERTSLAESALQEKKRGFALQCANSCSFKQTSCHMVIRGAHTFHPLALKSFGRHLFGKYSSDLSKWVPELDGLAVGSGDGLGDVLTVLDKIFEDMDSRYHTIFMLLTVYMPPNMLPHKVTQWLAINCKEEIDFIEKAVEDLWQKAFIEEIKPEIRIHDLFAGFAQSKARKRRKWLWCNQELINSKAKRGLFSEDDEGFELAKLEHCQHHGLSQIGDRYVKNLWALQVACNEISNLGLSSMKNIRSLTLQNCEYLEIIQGMENLPYLAWFQIVNLPKLKVLNLSSLTALQYLEINIGGPTELGDLTGCVSLAEIYVRCSSLTEFPRINGLKYLDKVKFKACEEVNGPLDCRACVKLRSIAFENCWQMVHIPLIDGCSNLSRIVLNRCDQVTEYSDEDESSALGILKLCISSEDASGPRHSDCCDGLKNIPLWNIVVSKDVSSLRHFPNLTVLKL